MYQGALKTPDNSIEKLALGRPGGIIKRGRNGSDYFLMTKN